MSYYRKFDWDDYQRGGPASRRFPSPLAAPIVNDYPGVRVAVPLSQQERDRRFAVMLTSMASQAGALSGGMAVVSGWHLFAATTFSLALVQFCFCVVLMRRRQT